MNNGKTIEALNRLIRINNDSRNHVITVPGILDSLLYLKYPGF
jgi:hypothetical protein